MLSPAARLKPIRRIIAGLDSQGRSTVLVDSNSPHVQTVGADNFGVTDLWKTFSAPADNQGVEDPCLRRDTGETQTSQFQKHTSAGPPGFEARAAACSRRPVSLGRNMSKRNRTVFDEGNLEAMVRLREQDEKFCQALRAAIQRGRESRPTGVSTEPCTQRPILNYTRPD